ncbi:MAG: MBL fold metallo-hydrolase [Gemmatimonadota bacterium]|nr:MBL fold metallo-hydrolase [Gemmatimonadota bacterium]MDH3424134.1 MBL fold metallo-hydrolase [Gemmatimonadota bacterium]
MKHVTRMVYLACAAAVSLAVPQALTAQQRDFSDVRITPHHVAGTVYYLEGQGGHVVVSAGEDGIVMVDDQFAPLTDRIIAAIRTISSDDIRFLINTHVHPDHTGGNENIGRLGIPIMARDRVRVRLMASLPEIALPVVTFTDDISLHLNGEDMEVITLPPAHTDGDSYIYFRGSDVLAAGDVFRTVAFPVIDLNNGGSLDGTIEALGMAVGLAGPNTRIVPGHGVVSTRADVMEFRDMVIDVKAQVSEMVARGMTYQQVAAANPTARYNAKWGDPERFLTAVYAELGGGS